MVVKHRKTDPACSHFRGYPTNPLARWWFDRGRGKACEHCSADRWLDALMQRYDTVPNVMEAERGLVWTCTHHGCGWTNTSLDAACQRCGARAVDGYGFR